MLTPQDISDKRFVKAVFGGYDMSTVDEFLEAVSADYNALYKENAILKGKLKVLVEKVEEYRSTEDAMRMALLTAQRMGEEITVEATRTKEEMLKSADEEVKAKLAEIAKKIAAEEVRLAAASKETTKFLELSQAILRKHSEVLKKLESANQTVKPPRGEKASSKREAPPPEPAPVQQQAVEEISAPVMPTPAPMPIPPITAHALPVEEDLDNIAQEIGNAVEKITSDGPEPLPPTAAPQASVASSPETLFEEQSDTKELPVADEIPASEAATPEASPRPRFDFDDLKFGANFDTDE